MEQILLFISCLGMFLVCMIIGMQANEMFNRKYFRCFTKFLGEKKLLNEFYEWHEERKKNDILQNDNHKKCK